MSQLIDISVALRPGMPIYPGDPEFTIRRIADVSAGDHTTLSEVGMGVHTGTHVDAPAHFIAGAPGMDALALDTLVGEALVVEVGHGGAIEVADLEPHGIRAGERVLLKTPNSALWAHDGFAEDFAHLSTPAAEWLAAMPVACVGIDYLSVGGFHRNGTEVHTALLGAGVWIVEGLDLSGVAPGRWELVCLPLRIAGAEAAPARAFLRPLAEVAR